MNWSDVSVPGGSVPCGQDGCDQVADWYGEAGGIGSYFCDDCRNKVDAQTASENKQDAAKD